MLTALNPFLLWGTVLVGAPILIHLFSKRRFKLVEWAAMQFLLAAERRNRRRLRLEEIILLLLRCLAILLLALAIARLALAPRSALAGAFKAPAVEHVLVIDDTASMGAQVEGRTAFARAIADASAFVREAAQERPGDTVTVLLASRPDRPLASGRQLAGQGEEIARQLGELKVADRAGPLDAALAAVERIEKETDGHRTKVVYLLGDLRARDWGGDAAPEARAAVQRRLQAIRARGHRVAVIDAGGEPGANLTVEEVACADPAVVVGVPCRFTAQVRNHGTAAASDVAVTLTAGGGSQRATIADLPPGGTGSATFTVTVREAGPLPVTAAIAADDLGADNARYLAAEAVAGVKVLLVDGEPGAGSEDAETFFLHRALAPPGPIGSGNAVEVVGETAFETLDLAPFQAVALCNLYRLGEERARSLDAWVRAGGGLILFLGDQVDETTWNQVMYRGGDGPLPLRLAAMAGDGERRTWAGLSPQAANHPLLRLYGGANNPFLARVKVFRWWKTLAEEPPAPGDATPPARPNDRTPAPATTQVLLALNDAERTPLLVEKRHGKGRVLLATTAADGEWSNWPLDSSFVVTALEALRHAARPQGGEPGLSAGAPLRARLDPAQHERTARVLPPGGAPAVEVRAVPSADGAALELTFPGTDARGLYELRLPRIGGGEDRRLAACNLDPAEGDLRRAEPGELKRRLAADGVDLAVSIAELASSAGGGRNELWRALLIALIAVLACEQGLAWWVRAKR